MSPSKLLLHRIFHRTLLVMAVPLFLLSGFTDPAVAISTDGQSAFNVIGQTTINGDASFNTKTVNNPMNIGMNSPLGAVIDSSRHLAYATDTNNNRVLVYTLNPDNSFIDYGADFIIGQPDFAQTLPNQGTGSPRIDSLESPTAVAVEPESGDVYVADAGNNRVLVFNSVNSNKPDAKFVIGASDYTSDNALGTVSQNRMYSPSGIAFTGSGSSIRVYIADKDFNRILVFGQIVADGQSALNVLGQSSFFTSGASLSQSGLASPGGIASDSNSSLYVADSSNNRIVVWSLPISSNGQSANKVLGQSWFYSNSSGTSAVSMSRPQGVAVSPTNEVLVADSGNNRVLIWTTSISVSGQPANLVLGQTNMTSNQSGTSSTKLSHPTSISSVSNTILISDSQNNRIIGYTSSVTSNGQAASFALGQLTDLETVDFYGNTSNNPQNRGVNNPSGIAIDEIGHRLFVADTNNNRVLVFSLDATNNLIDRNADMVIGQTSFSITSANQGAGATNSSLNLPMGVFFDSRLQRLYIADTGNNRILIYSTSITGNGQAANTVLGQPNFTSSAPSLTRAGLASPESVSVNLSTGALAVADRDNNRVLIWNTPPVANNAPASFVVGQSNFTSGSFGTSALLLHTPRGVGYDSNTGHLYVADTDNNRVLIWTSIISTNGQLANRVIGQADMTSGVSSPTSANSLNQPTAVTIGDSSGVVFVADTGNSRILTYRSAILANGQPANTVTGQATMTAFAPRVTQDGLGGPGAVAVDPANGKVYIADTANNRISIFDNVGPNQPISSLPIDGATGVSSTPTLQVSGLDPDGDALQYRLQISRDSEFNTEVLTYDQTLNQDGWSGQTIGNTYGQGSTAAFSVPREDILAAETTYWWRAYSYDVYGSKIWSEPSATKSFTTAAPSAIAISSISQSTVAGRPSGAIRLELQDSTGNLVKSSATTRVYLHSSSTTGSFSATASPFIPLTFVDLPAHSSGIDVFYRDSAVGNYLLTVSDSTPPNGALGLADAVQSINITPSVISSFSFSNIATQTAGVPFLTTITAIDIYGNVISDFNGNVNLSVAGETISPSVVTMTSGSWSGNITLTKAKNLRISVSFGPTSSNSPFFSVMPSTIATVNIAPGNSTLRAGVATDFTASPADAYGNIISAGVNFAWSVDPSIGVLTDDNQGMVSLTAGNSTATGLLSVVATEASSVVASVNISVIPHHYEISGLASNITAGSLVPVTISARSSSGGLISNANDSLILDDDTHFLDVKNIMLNNGSWSGTISITKSSTNNKISMSDQGGQTVSQSGQFNVIASSLDSVIISPSAISLSVNTTTSASAQAIDQYGNFISGVTYNWSATIGSAPATGQIITYNGGMTSGNGSLAVSVTEGSISKNASISVTVTSLPVHHFSFSVIPEQTAGQSFQVTIFARDQYDNLATSFTGNGSLTYSDGTITPANTADFANGSWTGSVRVTKTSPLATIKFTSGALSGTSIPFAVIPGPLSTIAINPASASIGLQQTQQFTTTAYDANANEISSGVQFSWSLSDTSLGVASPSSGQSTEMRTTTKSGTTYLNASAIEGDITKSTSILVNVLPGALDSFSFDPISSPQPTGELIPVKITARDSYGNRVTNFSSTVLLSDKSGTLSPSTSTNFSDGVWTGYVRISNVYSRTSVTATSGLISGTSNEFDVISNILDHVVITPSSSSITVGQTQAFSAQGYDIFGNAITGLGYTWSVIGAAGSISPENGLATTFTASPATNTGMVRVSVSQGNISKQANAVVDVKAGALDHFLFTPMPNIQAGQPTYLTVTAKDMYENTITSFSNSATLTDDLNGIVPTSTGPFTQGVWTGQVSFQKSGLNRVSATYAATTSSTDVFTVTPDSLYTADIGPNPLIVTAGKTQVITGYGKDRFGNIIEDVSYTWSVPSIVGTLSSTDSKEVTLHASTKTTQATINLLVSSGQALVSKSVDATVVSDVVAQFIIAQINSPQIAGSSFQVTATAADQYGNTVTNFTQTAALSDGTGSISPSQTSNFASGIWSSPVTITQTTDNDYITIRSGSVQSQSNQFAVEAGEQQVFLSIDGGSNQSKNAGSKLDSPLSVKAIDLYGNPMKDIPITFTIDSAPADSSGATMTPQETITDQEGRGMSELKLGNKTGTYVVTASIKGRSSVAVTFYATASTAATASVKVTPSTTTLLTGSSQLFTAQAFDSFGNQIPNISPEWSVVAGGGTISKEGVFTAGSTTRVFTNTVAANVNGTTGYASVTITTLPGITGDNREGAGEVDRLVLSPLESSVTVGGGIGFSVSALDRYNQEVNPSELSYEWEGTGGKVDASSANKTTFTAGGKPEPASISVRVTQPGKQLTKSAQTSIIIKPNPQGYLLVTTPKDRIVSGEKFQMSITAYKGDGSVNLDFNGSIELSDSTQTITPRVTGEFKKGTWSGQVAINSAEPTTVVKAAGQQVLGVSSNLKIENKFNLSKSNKTGILGSVYNFVATVGESVANFFHSFINVSGSYPETTRNIAAGGVAALGFIAAAISFGKVAASGMVAIGRNPYARKKIFISMLGAFLISLTFAGLAFLIAGFIKFL